MPRPRNLNLLLAINLGIRYQVSTLEALSSRFMGGREPISTRNIMQAI